MAEKKTLTQYRDGLAEVAERKGPPPPLPDELRDLYEGQDDGEVIFDTLLGLLSAALAAGQFDARLFLFASTLALEQLGFKR
ncbi:hypothetical protein SEA_JFLIX2_66 [Rhodococcus phage Jflix2]|nr:hypothetical protein SEA_JFLIX2_66 [Rhodococcus phage Jflix2]